MNLSEHLTLDEATRSETAKKARIVNAPGVAAFENMERVAKNIYEPCREYIGGPIFVSSFYRSPEVNALVGGALNSQHITGEAIDLNARTNGKNNAGLFYFIAENLEFDQLIYEFGSDIEPEWVHVSLKASGNRKEILRSYRVNGKVTYKIF